MGSEVNPIIRPITTIYKNKAKEEKEKRKRKDLGITLQKEKGRRCKRKRDKSVKKERVMKNEDGLSKRLR
jgi:hypothetical protein